MTFGVCIVIGFKNLSTMETIREPFMMIVYVAYVWMEGVEL